MSIEKTYYKSKDYCKVKFVFPKEAMQGAKSVALVGEFNGWNSNAQLLKKQKDGNFAASVNLNPGEEYQFRYLLDGQKWENDFNADKYVPSHVCEQDNSVVII